MTKQDKQLLLKDLCMRLPYGVKVAYLYWNEVKGEYIVPMKVYSVNTDGYMQLVGDVNEGGGQVEIDKYLPYLRPIFSMTEGEKNRFYSFMEKDSYGFPTDVINKEKIYEYINWLLANHFDFNDLIPKGLAITVTEQNNPYKT